MASDPGSRSDGLEVKPPPAIAGGVAALKATVAHVAHGPGLVRGTRALLAMNQPRRLRLPGLRLARAGGGRAIDRRVLRERREGGRRGGDDRARADAAFFARHAVAELAAQSRPLARPAGPPDRADVLRGGRHALPADQLGRRVRAHRRRRSPRWPDRTRPSSTPPGAPATRPRSSTSCSCAQLGTNNLPDCSNMCHESSGVGADARRSASARGRCSSTTSSTPTSSWSSARTRARTTRAC